MKHSKFNLDKKKSFCQRSPRLKPSFNGFCTICNRNQELKIQQLAAFVPQNENTYEQEIAEYKKKLEESYQLCSECLRHLKRTLTRVKTNVLGSKLAQLGKIGIKGLTAIDSHLKRKSVDSGSNRFKSIKVLTVIVIFLLSLVNFVIDSNGIWKIDLKEKGIVSDEIYKTFVIIYSHCAAFKETTLHLLTNSDIFVRLQASAAYTSFQNSWEKFNFEEIVNFLPMTAVLFNVLLMSLNTQHVKQYIIALFLLWSTKMCLNDFEISADYLDWIKVGLSINRCILIKYFLIHFQFAIASTILLTTLRLWNCLGIPEEQKNNSNSSFHRLYSEECSDESDTELDYSEGSMVSHQTVKRIDAKSATRLGTTLPMTASSYQPSVISLSASRTLINDYLEKLEPLSEMNHSFRSFKPNDSIPKYSETFGSFKNDIKNSSCFNLNDSINRSFSFRPIDKENDLEVQQDITKLQIGNSNNESVREFAGSKNPFSLDRSQCSTPTPSLISFTSSVVRSNVVQPPRLNLPVDSDPSASSWVAGGYWSSPQKRYLEKSVLNPPLSRTSSQSSGFESNKDKNSRENSIDKYSVFSEPVKPVGNLFQESFLRKPLLTPQISTLHRTNLNGSSFFNHHNLDNKMNLSMPNQFSSRKFGEYRDSFFK
jgi:hypothetical protein